MEIEFRVRGSKELAAALDNLGRKAPTAARRAVNRSVGVARQRVIRSVSAATGISRVVLGGRNTRRVRATGQTAKGRGYIKQVKASRRRSTGALVALVEGVRFSNTRRKTLGRLRPKPGGVSKPFRQTMPTGITSLFERTREKRYPIREIVIPIQPYAERAMRVHMTRAARSVYPQKLWEEIKKHIKPAHSSAPM